MCFTLQIYGYYFIKLVLMVCSKHFIAYKTRAKVLINSHESQYFITTQLGFLYANSPDFLSR